MGRALDLASHAVALGRRPRHPNPGASEASRGRPRRSYCVMRRVQQLREVAAVLRELAEEPSAMASRLNELAGDCETLAGSIEKLLVAENAGQHRRSG